MNDPLLWSSVEQFWKPTRFERGIGYSSPFGHRDIPIQFFPKFHLKVADWNLISQRANANLVGALHFNRDYRRHDRLEAEWLAVTLRPQEAAHPCSPTAAPSAAYFTAPVIPTVAAAPSPARKPLLTINHQWIRQQLATLPEPYYFWDIETAAPVVPRWRGFQTMQNVPFLSICQDTDAQFNPNITSTMFLDSLDNIDNLWQGIRSQLGDAGTIFTYSDFEWQQIGRAHV